MVVVHLTSLLLLLVVYVLMLFLCDGDARDHLRDGVESEADSDSDDGMLNR